MDRNDSNPGMVERQLDQSPMEGASQSDRELSRDGIHRDSSVEREGLQDGSVDRDSMHGGSGVERESMGDRSSSPRERESSSDESGMSGSSSSGRGSPDRSSSRDSISGRETDSFGVANTNSNDAEMRLSSREGGYGYDRPADVTVDRDTMESSSRDTTQGTEREREIDRGSNNPPARDW
jgi:hypothetical protein